jgi:hypothetical protein
LFFSGSLPFSHFCDSREVARCGTTVLISLVLRGVGALLVSSFLITQVFSRLVFVICYSPLILSILVSRHTVPFGLLAGFFFRFCWFVCVVVSFFVLAPEPAAGRLWCRSWWFFAPRLAGRHPQRRACSAWRSAADEHDYGQTLFVARVRAERSPDGIAYERFGDDGPTALLPRGGSPLRRGARRGTRGRGCGWPRSTRAAWLAPAPATAFGWRRRPLPCQRAAQRLSGDAAWCAQRTTAGARCWSAMPAQTLHRLARRDSNLGLRDALTLAELIEADRKTTGRADPVSAALLDAYVQRRREDRERTLASPTAWRN